MSQRRKGLIYNGTVSGPTARPSGAFDLQESPIVLTAAGLSAPVTIQVFQSDVNQWFDVIRDGAPLQLSADNTFLPLSVQATYRIKPGEATGAGVIAFAEVTSVPEWMWGSYGGGCGSGGGADVFLASSAVNAGASQLDLTLSSGVVVSQNLDDVQEWGTNAHITYGVAA